MSSLVYIGRNRLPVFYEFNRFIYIGNIDDGQYRSEYFFLHNGICLFDIDQYRGRDVLLLLIHIAADDDFAVAGQKLDKPAEEGGKKTLFYLTKFERRTFSK